MKNAAISRNLVDAIKHAETTQTLIGLLHAAAHRMSRNGESDYSTLISSECIAGDKHSEPVAQPRLKSCQQPQLPRRKSRTLHKQSQE